MSSSKKRKRSEFSELDSVQERSEKTLHISARTVKFLALNANEIKNKQKRVEVVARQHAELVKIRKQSKKIKAQEEEKMKAEGKEPPKKIPKTLENQRNFDETFVGDDEEIAQEEAQDEFASYFVAGNKPKILITTAPQATTVSYDFIHDLLPVFPNSFFYSRKKYPLKKVCEFATAEDYTDIIVIHEDHKALNSLLLIHLPAGPTAHFRLTSVVLSKMISGHGTPTSHRPELILNNFNTRLGHRVGRMFAALLDQEPQFVGRRVVTFHNQRDFIFFRHMRYIFDEPPPSVSSPLIPASHSLSSPSAAAASSPAPPLPRPRIQELGPRFTLKLMSLQRGTFDTKHGEYEWIYKMEMGDTRKQFFL